jgi:putative phage-type endonuclease
MGKRKAGLTKAQLEMRTTGIGASEIPIIAGLSPYGSAAEVYLAKKKPGEGRRATLAMRLGTITEDPIAQLYAEETGRHLARVDTVRSAENPLVLATPDRAVFTSKPPKGWTFKDAERLLQVKHTTWRFRNSWGEPGTDQVPEDHLAQVTWEMGTTGVSACDVAVLFDKDEFLIFTVEFNPDLFRSLVTIGEHFFRTYVETNTPPPADASERYREALTIIYPEERSADLKAMPPDLEDLAARLRVLEAIEREACSRGDLIRNELRRFIGDATGAISRVGTITWKKNADGKKTDWEKVAADLLAFWPDDSVGRGKAREFFEKTVRENTTVKPGARVLRKSWTKTLPPALEAVAPLLPSDERKALEARSQLSDQQDTEQAQP